MIYSTEFLLKARLELMEAWRWYEDKQPDLGDRFKQQVYDCIRTIEQHPERYPERRELSGSSGKNFPLPGNLSYPQKQKADSYSISFSYQTRPEKEI